MDKGGTALCGLGGSGMECPRCQTLLSEKAKYCGECGHNLKPQELVLPYPSSSSPPQKGRSQGGGVDDEALTPPAGLGRTLSTELIERQTELRTLFKVNALIESRMYRPGDVLIQKGERSRDLILLTEGLVEISKREGDGNLVLNEIGPPYVLGDIAFLSGLPRTATAKAKTEVKTFVLKYEDLRDLFKELPEWLQPLLTSFASGIKTLHHRTEELQRRISELQGETQGRNSTIQ
jgi:hypothetical protein